MGRGGAGISAGGNAPGGEYLLAGSLREVDHDWLSRCGRWRAAGLSASPHPGLGASPER